MYECLLEGCRLSKPWPEADAHDHGFDLDQTIVFRLEDRPLYKCATRGCPVHRLYEGPEDEYR